MKSQILTRQNTTLKNESVDLLTYFQQPTSARQKHYEAVRAVVVDHTSAEIVAERFGYTATTVYSLVRDAKAGKLELFPNVSKGPQGPRMDPEIQPMQVAGLKPHSGHSGQSVDPGIEIDRRQPFESYQPLRSRTGTQCVCGLTSSSQRHTYEYLFLWLS